MAIRRVVIVMLMCLVGVPFRLGVADARAATFVKERGRFRPNPLAVTPLDAALDDVGARARAMQARANEIEMLLAPEVTTLRRALVRQGAPPELAALVAGSLVREGMRMGISPRLLMAVMLVENPWIDPKARSHMGAIGLMQVMPFHAGEWDCPEGDLTVPEVNICYGARILAHALGRSKGDLDVALLRYNGCVAGANTPNCHEYPSWVRRARASLERLPPEPVESVVPTA